MAQSRRQRVRERAGRVCEYCQLPDFASVLPHEIDHIRAQKHLGPSTLANLAWACFYCNSFKGPNIAGYDPESGTLCPLFNPRTQEWSEHFQWQGALLYGLTPVGRTTVEILRINQPERVEHRKQLLELGEFPS